MSADGRKFVNFKSFPGKINKDTQIYEFPTLYTTSKVGNCLEWSIFIRLIKKASKKSFKKSNWPLTEEAQVVIEDKYLDDKINISEGTISEVWTESGTSNGKITRSAPTYPAEKNVRKSAIAIDGAQLQNANYRDCFKQALVLARGKYLKKVNDGGVIASQYGKSISTIHAKFFPMLAHKYDEYICKHKLKFPVYVQPKLDGVRCISYLYLQGKSIGSANISNVIMYTRNKKEYPDNDFNNNIRSELLQILKKYYGKYVDGESIYLDGELYNHGMKLQNINHYTRKRNLKEDTAAAAATVTAVSAIEPNGGAAVPPLQYWVYDEFYPSQKIVFADRIDILDELDDILASRAKYIKITETLQINTTAKLDKQYAAYIKGGYEGMMVRAADGLYTTSAKGSTGLRSTNLLKRKEVFTDEYKVVDWTQGNAGKEIGAIIWVCQTPGEKKFNVTPNMDYIARYAIYKECQKDFVGTYANRLLTVEYRGKSADNVPQHAKGITFRDIE